MPFMPLLDADQLRFPWVLDAVLRDSVHVHPLLNEQSVFALKPDLLTDRVGAAQLQGIRTWFTGPLKVKLALAGHVVFGIEIVTVTGWPGNNVAPGGLNVTPLTPVLDAVQFRLLWALAEVLSVAVQVQPTLEL